MNIKPQPILNSTGAITPRSLGYTYLPGTSIVTSSGFGSTTGTLGNQRAQPLPIQRKSILRSLFG
jgi:hypothetical protein